MESFLYSIDVAVFRWINEGWSNPFFDGFFAFITNYRHFLILLIPWALYLLVWGGEKGRWLVFSVALGLVASDQSSAHLFKGLFDRLRPCNALEGVLTPSGKSSAFSFPSSHAANMGLSMFLLAMAFRPWKWFFILIALLVGLSRIYLGLHYPSDVLAGYILGATEGMGVWWGMEKLKANFFHRQDAKTPRKAKRFNRRGKPIS
jgi:undecaprenyl-diphosphatase